MAAVVIQPYFFAAPLLLVASSEGTQATADHSQVWGKWLTYVHIRRKGPHHLSAALSDGVQVLASHENAVCGLSQNQGHIMHSSAGGRQSDMPLGIQKRAQAVAMVPVRALVILVHAVLVDVL